MISVLVSVLKLFNLFYGIGFGIEKNCIKISIGFGIGKNLVLQKSNGLTHCSALKELNVATLFAGSAVEEHQDASS